MFNVIFLIVSISNTSLQLVGFHGTFGVFGYITCQGFSLVGLTLTIPKSNFALKVLPMPYACVGLKDNADMKVEPYSVGGSQHFRKCYTRLKPGHVQSSPAACICIQY
jgi:hypothetical protein